MAVKLSRWYWFRNNYLVTSLEEGVHTQTHWFGKELSEQDRRALESLVKNLDRLKEDSHFTSGKPVIAPEHHVIIGNVTELKDVTSDRQTAAHYLEGIHGIMEKYWVNADLYEQLGHCFEELGITPSKDIAEAIKYVKENCMDRVNPRYVDCYASFSWKNIKEHRQREIEKKK